MALYVPPPAVAGSLTNPDFAIECAFSLTPTGDAIENMHLLGKMDNTIEYAIRIDTVNPNILVLDLFQADGTNVTTEICQSLTAAGVVATNSWHWLSVNMDYRTAGELTCNIDNNRVTTTDVSLWSGNWRQDVLSYFTIGSDGKDGTNVWYGSVDEVSIYLKSLSDDERTSTYSAWAQLAPADVDYFGKPPDPGIISIGGFSTTLSATDAEIGWSIADGRNDYVYFLNSVTNSGVSDEAHSGSGKWYIEWGTNGYRAERYKFGLAITAVAADMPAPVAVSPISDVFDADQHQSPGMWDWVSGAGAEGSSGWAPDGGLGTSLELYVGEGEEVIIWHNFGDNDLIRDDGFSYGYGFIDDSGDGIYGAVLDLDNGEIQFFMNGAPIGDILTIPADRSNDEWRFTITGRYDDDAMIFDFTEQLFFDEILSYYPDALHWHQEYIPPYVPILTPITNTQQETRVNDDKRKIKIIRREFVSPILENIKDLL